MHTAVADVKGLAWEEGLDVRAAGDLWPLRGAAEGDAVELALLHGELLEADLDARPLQAEYDLVSGRLHLLSNVLDICGVLSLVGNGDTAAAAGPGLGGLLNIDVEAAGGDRLPLVGTLPLADVDCATLRQAGHHVLDKLLLLEL